MNELHATQIIRDQLEVTRSALAKLWRIRREITESADDEQCNRWTCGLAAIHESLALPAGEYGRVALCAESEVSAARSDEIDEQLEFLSQSSIWPRSQRLDLISTVLGQIEDLAIDEERRLAATSFIPPRHSLTGNAWSLPLMPLLQNQFFSLHRRGL